MVLQLRNDNICHAFDGEPEVIIISSVFLWVSSFFTGMYIIWIFGQKNEKKISDNPFSTSNDVIDISKLMEIKKDKPH